MALTITEANDVQTLGRWVLGVDHADPDVAELLGDQARAALARLLDRSHAKIMAGRDRRAVDERWPAPGLPRGCRLRAEGRDA